MQTGDVAIARGPAHYTVGDEPSTAPDIVVHADNRLTTIDGTDALRLGPRTSGRNPAGSAILASGTYQVSNDVTGRLLSALPDIVLIPHAVTHRPVHESSGRGGRQ